MSGHYIPARTCGPGLFIYNRLGMPESFNIILMYVNVIICNIVKQRIDLVAHLNSLFIYLVVGCTAANNTCINNPFAIINEKQ